jgi:hypothetical protein
MAFERACLTIKDETGPTREQLHSITIAMESLELLESFSGINF